MADLSKISLYNRLGTAEGKLVKVVTLSATHTSLDGKDAVSADDIAGGDATGGIILGGSIETKTAFTKGAAQPINNGINLTTISVGGVDIVSGISHDLSATTTTAFTVMRQLDAGASELTIITNDGDDLSAATAGEVEIKLFIAVPA